MCELCDVVRLKFFGGPADGFTVEIPRGMPTVRIPVLLAGGLVQAVYERRELTTGPAMVCEGVWPIKPVVSGA